MTVFIVLTIITAIGLSATVNDIIIHRRTRRKIDQENRKALVQAQHRMIHTALGIHPVDMPPRRPLPLWSEEERELFGYNDTERFIKETDEVLKGIEWDQKVAEISPQELATAAADWQVARALGVPNSVFRDGEWKAPRSYVSDTPAGLDGAVAVETTKDLSSLRARPERPGLWAKPTHWTEDETDEGDRVFAWGQVEPIR